MYGRGFFTSAKDSFSLIARNIVRTVVLGRVVAFLLFVGKASITIGLGNFPHQNVPKVDFYFQELWHFIIFLENGSSMDFPKLLSITISYLSLL